MENVTNTQRPSGRMKINILLHVKDAQIKPGRGVASETLKECFFPQLDEFWSNQKHTIGISTDVHKIKLDNS